MLKKKKGKELLQSITYMQAAVALFGLEVFLLTALLAACVRSGGAIGLGGALLGMLIWLMSLAGIGITLFGHFRVRMDGKWPWRIGVQLNGIVTVIMTAFYVIGLF